MSQVTAPGSAAIRTKWVYYCNKNVAGTAINEQIKPGYAVCFNHAQTAPGMTADQSKGQVVSKPETGNLAQFAGIVMQAKLEPSSGVANAAAGWIEIATAGDAVNAMVLADATANTTGLIISNGAWTLSAAQSAGNQTDSVAELLALVGVALETANTSSTAAIKRVLLKGPGVSQA